MGDMGYLGESNKFYVTDQNQLKFPNAYWISKNNLRKMNMDLSNCDICTLCLIVRASGPELGLFVTSKKWMRAPE